MATETPTNRPRRYANGRARREQILDSAQALYAESGIQAVSLRAVAREAGISHPGLLRHFDSREALLAAVIERYNSVADTRTGAALGRQPSGLLGLVEVARRNDELPGYVPLFTALAGQATAVGHPAHAYMAGHYDRFRRVVAPLCERSMPGSDGSQAATALAAAWDGLAVQSLFDATIRVPVHLDQHIRRLVGAPTPAGGAVRDVPAEPLAVLEDQLRRGPHDLADVERGYAPGRSRRDALISAAIRLFTRQGYYGTSLAEITAEADAPAAAVVHHFGTKDQLLAAVLHRRDVTGPGLATEHREPLEVLRGALATARASEDEPHLVELYAVLSCEATAPAHPAHSYFAHRYDVLRRLFTRVFAELADAGQLAPGRDPAHEAVWLIALWDGLQLQWLYDSTVSIPEMLRTHLVKVVPAA